MRNVTEWAKQQACWAKVELLNVDWPVGLGEDLVGRAEKRERERSGRQDQKLLNGIEAQSAVVNAGHQFWQDVVLWGQANKMLSDGQLGALIVASRMPGQVPSERQSVLALETLDRLRQEGFSLELPKS